MAFIDSSSAAKVQSRSRRPATPPRGCQPAMQVCPRRSPALPLTRHPRCRVHLAHRRQRANRGGPRPCQHRLRLHPLLNNVDGAEGHARNGLQAGRQGGQDSAGPRAQGAGPPRDGLRVQQTRTCSCSVCLRPTFCAAAGHKAAHRATAAAVHAGSDLRHERGRQVRGQPRILRRHPLAQLVAAARERQREGAAGSTTRVGACAHNDGRTSTGKARAVSRGPPAPA